MGSKKTKTTQVTTPDVPDYIKGPMQSLYGQVDSLSGVDPHSLVAGMDPLQQQVTDSVSKLGASPASDWIRSVGNGSVMGGGGAGSGQWGGAQKFLDPTLDFTLNSTLNNFDRNSMRQREGQLLRTSGGNTGSNAQVGDALLSGELASQRGQLEGGIRSNAWGLASQLADSQAGRDNQLNMQGNALASQERMADASNKLQAAGLMGSEGRANAALQSDIGGINRGIGQQDLNAPTDYLAKLSAILGGLPGQMDVGQTSNTTQKTSGGGLSSALGLAALVAAPFTGGASLASMFGMGGAGALGAMKTLAGQKMEY